MPSSSSTNSWPPSGAIFRAAILSGARRHCLDRKSQAVDRTIMKTKLPHRRQLLQLAAGAAARRRGVRSNRALARAVARTAQLQTLLHLSHARSSDVNSWTLAV